MSLLAVDENYSRMLQEEAISRFSDALMNNATATNGKADAEK